MSLLKSIKDNLVRSHIKEDDRYEKGLACEYCQGTFELMIDFQKHLKTQHSRTPLDCVECGKSFTSAVALRNHEVTHGARNYYNCSVCCREFLSYLDLKESKVIYSDEFTCKNCSVMFSTEQLYKNHVAECTSELPCDNNRYLCDICNVYFVGIGSLNQHRKIHKLTNVQLDKVFKCFHCLANFSYQETLDIHLQTVHGQQDLNHRTEHGCASAISKMSDMLSGKDTIHQTATEPLLCGICDEDFSDIDQLGNHFNACHTGDQPIFCDVCSVGCVKETQLVSHMKIHVLEEVMATKHSTSTEEYPFVCKLCPKRFHKENEAARHAKLHTEKNTFKCDRCSASFLIKSRLDKHMLVHLSQHTYSCDICFQDFRLMATLAKHKMYAHNLKNNNKCDICSETFFSQSLLLLHLDSHGDLGATTKRKIQMDFVKSSIDEDQGNIDASTCKFSSTECTSFAELTVHVLSHGESSPTHFCKVCQRSFKDEQHLEKHYLQHKKVKNWPCDICDKSFGTKLTYVRHFYVHLREALDLKQKIDLKERSESAFNSLSFNLLCQECNIRFRHKSHFVRHKLMHAEIPLFKCGICGKLFVHKVDIYRHKMMHTATISCDFCGNNFHKLSLYELHKKEHLFNWPFKCDTCDKRFSTNSSYITHLLIHSRETPFMCNPCIYSFSQCSSLAEHQQSQSDVQIYSCHVCNKQLASNKSLKSHCRIHTGERPYKCPDCPKSFVSKRSLTVHASEHFRSDAFSCNLCSHKFKQESHLVKHKLFHQYSNSKLQPQHAVSLPSNEIYAEELGTSLYMCDICGRVFKRKKYLIKHHNVHRFVCTFCSKILTSNLALKNHLLIHSGEFPHKCTLCKKKFRYLSNLKRHQSFHLKKKNFRCIKSKDTFFGEHELEKHKQVHPTLLKIDLVNSSVTETTNLHSNLESLPAISVVIGKNDIKQEFTCESEFAEIPKSKITQIEPSNCDLRVLSPCETKVTPLATQLEVIAEEECTMKSYQCDVCFKTFAKRQYLTKHKYRHRDVKAHPCDICGKRFAQKFEVAVHKMKHTGQKPYQCNICNKNFRSKVNLINHVMKHSGDYPFICSICTKGMPTQLLLEKHIGSHYIKCLPLQL